MANLQQATDSLKAYRAAVSQFRDSQVASAAALKRMSAQGDILLDVSKKSSPSRKPSCVTPMRHTPKKPAADGHRPGVGLWFVRGLGHHSPDCHSSEPDPQSGRACRRGRPDS
ncbi:hypothetical protein ACFS4T_02705 [Pseudomonas lini]